VVESIHRPEVTFRIRIRSTDRLDLRTTPWGQSALTFLAMGIGGGEVENDRGEAGEAHPEAEVDAKGVTEVREDR